MLLFSNICPCELNTPKIADWVYWFKNKEEINNKLQRTKLDLIWITPQQSKAVYEAVLKCTPPFPLQTLKNKIVTAIHTLQKSPPKE